MNYYIIEEKLHGRSTTRDGEDYLIDDLKNGKTYYKVVNYLNDKEIKYLPLSVNSRFWEGDIIYKDSSTNNWLIVDTTPLQLAFQGIVAINNQEVPFEFLSKEVKEAYKGFQDTLEHYMEHPNLLNYSDSELYLRLREKLEDDEDIQELIG